jgi:DNA-binding MurR/RpiR family transcriptional regulator
MNCPTGFTQTLPKVDTFLKWARERSVSSSALVRLCRILAGYNGHVTFSIKLHNEKEKRGAPVVKGHISRSRHRGRVGVPQGKLAHF